MYTISSSDLMIIGCYLHVWSFKKKRAFLPIKANQQKANNTWLLGPRPLVLAGLKIMSTFKNIKRWMLCKYWITSTYSNWSDWGCQLSDGMLLGVLVRLSLPAEHVWRLLLNQHCLFLHLWGNWPCTTRIAYPLLPVWSPRICRVRFHLNFKFTPLFFALFKDLNLVGIGRIGLDFVGIRRIRFHFIWIWGCLWYASSWGCPISLFGSRLLHSDVVSHPVRLWLSLNRFHLDF